MVNEIINKRHAAYQTPAAVIFELVKRATGQDAVHREKIVRGYDNEVYTIQTRQNQNFIVRISRFGNTGFRQEAWAMEKCRAVGVPVPEIALIDTIEIDGQQVEMMLQRKLPGTSLAEIRLKLTPDEFRQILQQAGAILSKIHSIKVDGFYKMNADGIWDFPDWKAITASARRNRRNEKPFILQAGFCEAEFDMMMHIMEYKKFDVEHRQPVLCHADFLLEHIFVDERLTISGIIDFGEFQGGLPIHDFAIFSFEHPEINLDWLKAGYADQALFDEYFTTRLLVYKLGLQIGYLTYYVQTGNTPEILFTANGLRDILENLSTGNANAIRRRHSINR
jgi:aminoglycoside phosphotransferase (APT) family kinase protein